MRISLALNDDAPRNAIKIIVDAAEAIRPTELARNPFNILEIVSMLLYLLKKL